MSSVQGGNDSVPTKEKLLSLVDDIELISKELIENSVLPKPKKMSASDHEALTKLLVEKDKQLKHTMVLAMKQGQIESNIQELTVQVKKHDEAIKDLQKKFKDAETLLATAIFQAKQKLDSIGRAKESPVSSEDLIKYAHRVSASNAVCAPLNWQQGDPRRPYPTDMEMRNGFLGRIGEAGAVGWPPGASPALSSGGGGGGVPTAIQPSPKMQPPMGVPAAASAVGGAVASAGQFAWQQGSGEVTMTMKDGSSVPIETAGGRPDGAAGEVDVMSTGSSSSSSTDSN